MAKGFNNAACTLPAATAIRVSDLMVQEGYTGRMLGARLQIETGGIGDVLLGDDPTTVATTGVNFTTLTRQAPPAVDPSRLVLHSVTGGDISIMFEPM